MFTGIVEALARVERIENEGTNRSIWFSAPFLNELKIDQSVSHNGVCLTIDQLDDNAYRVTAIDETLKKSNIGSLETGSMVNVERCMKADGRFDGHIVQGHVDGLAKVMSIKNENGSWVFQFQLPSEHKGLIVEKGSISINGTSLTVFDVHESTFSVAIIPYTYEHTNMQYLSVHDQVNIEFDILGKYVQAATRHVQD